MEDDFQHNKMWHMAEGLSFEPLFDDMTCEDDECAASEWSM